MCDERVDEARLIDHLVVLDRWSRFAWSVCGEVSVTP